MKIKYDEPIHPDEIKIADYVRRMEALVERINIYRLAYGIDFYTAREKSLKHFYKKLKISKRTAHQVRLYISGYDFNV